MIRLILLLFSSSMCAISLAQNNPLNCGGGRYAANIFTNVKKTVGVTYGFNTVKNEFSGATRLQELKFDFYEPQSDVATKRPLVIVMFGGAFVVGQRSDLDAFCTELAKKGYAAATIDYRLVENDFFNLLTVFGSTTLLADEVIKASADLKAAIRYFKEDAATTNIYKVDTTNIIVGGASAGSIAALHTAYIDDVNEHPPFTTLFANNGGYEGNTYLTPGNTLSNHSSKGIVGVINIAGGIIDTALINSNDPPIYNSQGTMDEVVPYNYAQVIVSGFTTPTFLYGSNLVHTRALNVGLKSELLPVPGGNHESPGNPPYIFQIIQDASTFLSTIVCSGTLPVTLSNFIVSAQNCQPVLRWKTATEQQSSHYDVEMSTDGLYFTKVGKVASNNTLSGGEYVYQAASQVQPVWFRLRMQDKDGRFTYSPVQQFKPQCQPSIRLYPNPARSFTTVSGLSAGMQVKLVNTSGSVVFSQKAAGSIMQLPLSKLANGLYLVQVADVSGHVTVSQKLLKN